MPNRTIKIDVKRLNECRAFLRFVDSTPIENIVFVHNGVEMPMRGELAEQWKTTGRPNQDCPDVLKAAALAAVNNEKPGEATQDPSGC